MDDFLLKKIHKITPLLIKVIISWVKLFFKKLKKKNWVKLCFAKPKFQLLKNLRSKSVM